MRILDDRRQGHGSIRTRLTAVVVFSSVALVVGWVVISLPRLYDAVYLRAVTDATVEVMPRATRALAAVQAERAESMHQATAGAGPTVELATLRTQTDAALKEVRELTEPLLPQAPRAVQDRYADFTRTLAEMGPVRAELDAKTVTRPELYDFYNKVADVSIAVFDTMARTIPDQETSLAGVEVNSLFRAADLMSRSGTVISGSISTGALNSVDHAEFARLSGAYRHQLELSVQNASDEVKARYQDILSSNNFKRLTAAEDTLIESGAWTVTTARPRAEGQVAAPPVGDQEWRDASASVYREIEQLGVAQFATSSRIAAEKAGSGLTNAIIGSGIALLVAIMTIIVAVRIMRSTTRRLTRLRYETLDLAVEKLPPIVRRLRAGEQVNTATELPSLEFGKDEIGQVARAFNAAQSTAVEAAVQESQARAGVRNVFLGIAHRSQALVHRQLKILDKLEREEEDPQQLEALFNLDHLATRARRNAENLIILGGQQPGRAWRKPVLLADILRGAVAETTQYKRIRLQGVPRVLLSGSSVADTMHLLAELLDNATSFSPPQAQVRLSGEHAAKGIVVEVEDNGLGMDHEAMQRHNMVLVDPPDFDTMALKGDPRLGLFVVARLAARHGIKVELRSSSYGGTRAVVLIPATLLVDEDHDDTGVFEPIPVRAGSPDPDFVDDVLPYRVSLFTPLESNSGGGNNSSGGNNNSSSGSSATRLEERPVPVAGHAAEPEWPKQEMPDDEPPPVVVIEGKPSLPKRRRQASLAPQLKTSEFTPLGDEDDPDDGRSPDEIRNMMSAFQQESRRARDEDEDE
ncbi:MAG: nitrate- and nitrite sensing domain-containing protein [Kibdelosporangium sp.]